MSNPKMRVRTMKVTIAERVLAWCRYSWIRGFIARANAMMSWLSLAEVEDRQFVHWVPAGSGRVTKC
jgi:hypothetical protein